MLIVYHIPVILDRGFLSQFIISKNSAGVIIAGFFTPDSKKSLSPVSSTSAFASMAARKMGRSFTSLICVSDSLVSIGTGTSSKVLNAIERNLSSAANLLGNFLLNIRFSHPHFARRLNHDWDRRLLLHMRETECHLHLRQQKSGHLCQLKLSCIFVLISQFLDKRHHIIFRSQSSPLCFSGHSC